MKSLFDVERQELAALLAPSYRATQIFKSVYQRWADTFEEMTDLPKAERTRAWPEPGRSRPPRIHRRFDSNDGTRRYLVLARRRRVGRDRLHSRRASQHDLHFFAGGMRAGVHVLSDGEARTQAPSHGRRDRGAGPRRAARQPLPGKMRDSFNIVLMGMGEPLHNYDNVMKAIRILHDPEGMNMSMSRITLSTAGMLPAIERLAAEPAISRIWRFR